MYEYQLIFELCANALTHLCPLMLIAFTKLPDGSSCAWGVQRGLWKHTSTTLLHQCGWLSIDKRTGSLPQVPQQKRYCIRGLLCVAVIWGVDCKFQYAFSFMKRLSKKQLNILLSSKRVHKPDCRLCGLTHQLHGGRTQLVKKPLGYYTDPARLCFNRPLFPLKWTNRHSWCLCSNQEGFLMTNLLHTLSFRSFLLLLYGRGSWGSYQGQLIVFGCVTYSVAPHTSL